ncbi:hypothetical protein AUEXF2481DRAFT_217537 [Aureobasidium subglaciale EXF-2481]|uniref:Uncharacterized protein n=1 Tax=Aureobasidium subglaciale (strain EXF-2481) TaxID=1043005 RepID=A0A074YC71_AURSE|nr:uncharacterized protein AUEXF2481DRAFT_217537 [Aureobasidium subglaciale EXF-2481]KEQ95398.1 hypothetical protein AUEXF2481DRAFT_217537 [Aureobasidium subglaciale EXF-2481]
MFPFIDEKKAVVNKVRRVESSRQGSRGTRGNATAGVGSWLCLWQAAGTAGASRRERQVRAQQDAAAERSGL